MILRVVAELGTEEIGDEGPTGRVRVVLVAELRDFGENPLGRATTVRGVARVQRRWRIPTRWRVIREGRALKPGETVMAMI